MIGSRTWWRGKRQESWFKTFYRISKVGAFAKDFGLRDQIRRASISIMSNIAEGFERGGRAEFHQFLVLAKASCAELRSQLYVAKDVGYLRAEAFDTLMHSTEELGRVIGGLRVAVQRQRDER
ncbi:MAG: four helix bundle protein [Burkholderiales bacterium]